MNTKIKGLILTLVVVFCLGSIAPYAYAAELKIGYVDLAYVFDNYSKTKEQDKVLEEKSKQKREERQRLVNQIRKMKDEIDILSDKAKEKKQTQIDEKITELQEYDQQTKISLGQERDKTVREILEEINTVVEKDAGDESYTMILNSRVLVFGKKQYDLTDEILKTLNSKRKR